MDFVPTALKQFALAAVIVTAACSAPSEPSARLGPLANTFESPQALAQAVLTALEQGDIARLQSLALSEDEFRLHVWPELPTSRPERNVPFEYAWGQLKQRSDASLSQTFSRYRRRPLKLVRTRFSGETTKYQSFEVMRQNEIVATDDNGQDLVLHLFGSALVKDGRYKLFSFVVDD